MATFDRDAHSADDILGKADALLARHRGTRSERAPEPTGDFPILTEVVDSAQPEPVDLGALSLDDLERELRVELLDQLASELGRQIEMRVNERVGLRLNEIIAQIRIDLTAEVERVIKETVAEAMDQALKKTRGNASADPRQTTATTARAVSGQVR